MTIRVPSPVAVLCIAGIVVTGAAPAQDLHGDYNNGRFGYYVSYPAHLLRAMPEAINGDGREFVARKGKATARVWGAWYTADDPVNSARAVAQESVQACGSGSSMYRVDKPTLQVVSCVLQDGTVLYVKSVQAKGVVVALELRYPQAEKSTWDTVAAMMEKSLLVFGPPTP